MDTQRAFVAAGERACDANQTNDSARFFFLLVHSPPFDCSFVVCLLAQEQQQQGQGGQEVSVTGGDMYSVGFIMILLLLGMMKAAANRCTC